MPLAIFLRGFLFYVPIDSFTATELVIIPMKVAFAC
jgi:hypothetical protein